MRITKNELALATKLARRKRGVSRREIMDAVLEAEVGEAGKYARATMILEQIGAQVVETIGRTQIWRVSA